MTKVLTLPNILGGLRFLSAFVLVGVAFSDGQLLFIGILVLALLLDAIDGPIARYYHQTSEQGSRLDTIADFFVYTALVIGVWQLWPDIFEREMVFIGLAAMSMLLPFIVALIKFHTFTSYHTWLVKFATVCIAFGSIILIMGGPAWPFRIASLISVLGGLEQIIITLMLTKPRTDIRHCVQIFTQKDSRD